MSVDSKVVAVVPVFNEADTITATIRNLKKISLILY